MKMAETYFAKNGETLEGIWFERAAAFERAEFNALNAHLPATLVAGDQVAIPKTLIDSFARAPAPAQPRPEVSAALEDAKRELASLRQKVAASQGSSVSAPVKKLAVVSADDALTAEAKARLAQGGTFTWEKLGLALVEDADLNIQRLAAEQDAVGAKYTGVKREAMGVLAAGGGFAGKFFHSFERLAGLALSSVAGGINDPDRIAETIRALKESISLEGVGNVMQTIGENATEAYDRRGLLSVLLEGTLTAWTFKGGTAATQQRVLTKVADAAVDVIGHEKQISKWAEYLQKALKHSEVLTRIADNAAAPLVATRIVPGLSLTRASVTANVVSNPTSGQPAPAAELPQTSASAPN